MRTLLAIALCGVLAACSQTSTPADAGKPTPSARKQAATSKQDACDAAVRKQANSAMLGSALGMAGSLGGFGGHDGAVAAQIASTAGGVIARQQQAQAQADMMRDCGRSGY